MVIYHLLGILFLGFGNEMRRIFLDEQGMNNLGGKIILDYKYSGAGMNMYF